MNDYEKRMKLKKYANPNYGEPNDDPFTEEQRFNDALDSQDYAAEEARLRQRIGKHEKLRDRAILFRNIGIAVAVLGLILLSVSWLLP